MTRKTHKSDAELAGEFAQNFGGEVRPGTVAGRPCQIITATEHLNVNSPTQHEQQTIGLTNYVFRDLRNHRVVMNLNTLGEGAQDPTLNTMVESIRLVR